MKKTYSTFLQLTSIFLIFVSSGMALQAQTIRLSFANAQNTNDGTHDYYEVDVLVETWDGMPDFKLGACQFYFNYNTDAFGENIYDNDNQDTDSVDITYPNDGGPDSYIAGQGADLAPTFKMYGPMQLNNNTDFRLSYSHQQAASSGSIAENNITSTPQKLVHIKIKYIDITQDPMVVFEDDESRVDSGRDQNFIACGPSAGFAAVDCFNYPGSQIHDAVFDSAGATLSNTKFEMESQITIYPNPASEVLNISTRHNIQNVEMFDILGKSVKRVSNSKSIDVSDLKTGIYFVKVLTDKGQDTKKVVIE